MAEQLFHLDGQQLTEICKTTVPDYRTRVEGDDAQLLATLQALNPDYPMRLVTTGEEWYRLGGIVDSAGNRIANDVIEWTERTYIECGKNLQILIDYARQQQFIATRQIGNTLHVVVQTGSQAEDFVQIDVDKTHEVADRLVVSSSTPPDDLEEVIDPLVPEAIDSFFIGSAKYVYRRKTDVAVFMTEINKYHLQEHPVQRFMDDWNRSSAGQHAVFSEHWIVRPYQHTGRFGEQIINVEIMNAPHKHVPQLRREGGGKKGLALQTLLRRFDNQVGVSFAWFFYMVKGKHIAEQNGLAVFQDINSDFSYLPERDVDVLNDWVNTPYNV